MKYHTKHLNVDSVCKIQMPLQQTNAYIVYIDISIRAWKIVWTHPSRRTSNNLPQIKPCTNSTPRFVAGSGSGVPGGGETKNKSQKKIAGFFQKMKKYWSKFRSIKNTNRIDMQYVVAKLCFRTQVSCKYTHTHATKPPAKRLSCRIEFGPGPLPKRETRHPILLLTCYWHRCLVIRGKLL